MKPDVKTARAYARALFESARRSDSIARARGDLETACRTVASSPDLRRLSSESTLVARLDRVGAIRTVFGGRLGPAPLLILERMAAWGHLHLLPAVAADFDDMARAGEGRLRVRIETAHPLGDRDLQTLRDRLAPLGARVFEFDIRVEPNLIAGLTVRAGDRFFDCSLAGRLDRLKTELARI